jgi:hypothetical protein
VRSKKQSVSNTLARPLSHYARARPAHALSDYTNRAMRLSMNSYRIAKTHGHRIPNARVQKQGTHTGARTHALFCCFRRSLGLVDPSLSSQSQGVVGSFTPGVIALPTFDASCPQGR